jgi:hypothetical protein
MEIKLSGGVELNLAARKFRRVAAVATQIVMAISVSACLSFAPPYDSVLDDKTTAAYEHVSKLLAEVELGKYATPDSFAAATDEYADIQALLSVASMRAQTISARAGTPAETARNQLKSFVDGCKGAITSLSNLHKTAGLIPASGVTARAQVECDQAARAARAMKGS